MTRIAYSRRIAALAVTFAFAATACNNKGDAADTPPPAPEATLVGPEAMAIVKSDQIRTGPALSGTLTAESEAQVRAEIGGAVLQALAEAGQAVRAGQELVRIDESAIRDQSLSARSGVTTAQNTVQVATREVERAEALAKAGAVADRVLEQARNTLTGAQAMLADARARMTSAQQQLEKTVVRAPFNGVVSARTVNAGDVIQPGTPLYTIVNPSTMRLEASVPAEQLSQVRIGLPVEFTVNGYPTRKFLGRVLRINPSADPATGQVRVIVSLPNAGNALVAGLFAQGRIASETRMGALIPTSAVDESGVRPAVMRVKNGKVERAEVMLGIRDTDTEMIEIQSGLAPGDTILLGAARGIAPGSMVKVSVPTDVKR